MSGLGFDEKVFLESLRFTVKVRRRTGMVAVCLVEHGPDGDRNHVLTPKYADEIGGSLIQAAMAARRPDQ